MTRTLATGLILTLNLSAGASLGQADSPDQVFHQYIDAKKAGDWEHCARLMHGGTLARIQEMLAEVVQADDSGEILQKLFNTRSVEEFEKLTQVQLFSRLLDAMTRNLPRVSQAPGYIEPTMLGQVEESADIRHIVYRQYGDVLGTAISTVEILTLQREGGIWRVQDTAELEGLVAMVRNMVASTKHLPGPLVLLSDADATLWIDDVDKGALVAGVIRNVDLRPGRHWLAAKTEDGVRQWGRFVHVPPDERLDVIISLRSGESQPAADPKAAAAAANPPRYVTPGLSPPERITFVKPTYPEDARERKEEGKVVLEITIDVAGNVAHVSVLKSNPTFDEAAIQAARQWKYKPASENGRPVPVWLTVVVEFSLK